MDDLIVIILTLIIAGVGVLGQYKKKKQIQPTAEGNVEPAKSFWDLIMQEPAAPQQMEDLEFDSPDYYDEENEVGEEVQSQIKKPAYQNESNTKIAVNKKTDIKKTKGKKMRSILNEDFSLRKAVIYSEILNRKYT